MSDDAKQAPQPMQSDVVVHAEPAQVRRIRLAAILIVVFALMAWLLLRFLRAYANPHVELDLLYAACWITGIGLFAVAVHAVRYARRVFAAAQYPPPGGWVLGATRIVHGPAARMRGILVSLCAVTLAALALYALALPVVLDRIEIAAPSIIKPGAPVQIPAHPAISPPSQPSSPPSDPAIGKPHD